MGSMIRAICALLLPSLALAQTPTGWPLHGYDLAGTRYSPLTEIDTSSVARLEPKWTWHSGVTATFQATPIVLDTVMYVSLPVQRGRGARREGRPGALALPARAAHRRNSAADRPIAVSRWRVTRSTSGPPTAV